MKKFIKFIVFNLMIIASGSAQEEIELNDLKTPNSPGFQIIDVAPSTIERPTNPKEFALSLMSLSNNGTTIPKNFSMEISPYWFLKSKDENVYKYLSVYHNSNNKDEIKTSYDFSGILRKLSFSLASNYNEQALEGIQKNTNYVAFGIRTNLLTIRTIYQNKNFKESLDSISTRIGELRTNDTEKKILKDQIVKFKKDSTNQIDPDKRIILGREIFKISIKLKEINDKSSEELEKILDNDEISKRNFKKLEELPLFQLDAAYAYSEAIPENEYNNKRFNRSGFWLTGAINTFSGGENEKELNDNLSFIGSVRFISDNVLEENTTDDFRFISDNVLEVNTTDVFIRKNAFDYGIKIEYSIKAFSLSIEYLKRQYSNNSELNSERTVGVIQYKISDGVYFTGSYGKNFGEVNNLFTLFGINYGFGNSKLSIAN